MANGFDPVVFQDHIGADVTLWGHELELGHSTAANGWRWKYDYAYNKARNQPHDSTYILTWGERLQAPGTVVAND